MTFLPQSSLASAPATPPTQVADGKGRDWEDEEMTTVGEDQI